MKGDRKELQLARRYRKAGGTKERYLEVVEKNVRERARKEGWRPSEVAITIAKAGQIAGVVWAAQPKSKQGAEQ